MTNELVVDWKPDVGFYVLAGNGAVSNYDLWCMITSGECILTHSASCEIEFSIADSMGNLG